MMKYNKEKSIQDFLISRAKLFHGKEGPIRKCDEEGGCGVTGFISSVPIRGHHIYEPSLQMHNRGNGKGGGIAALGLSADDLGVTQDVLDSHYLLQVAYLDPDSIKNVESTNIRPFFDIHKAEKNPTIDDYREIGLEIKPPDVWRYFVRVKRDILDKFITENNFSSLERRRAEDEFVFQNSIRINQTYYASLGEKQAFVMSNGRNVMILKIVGYAEQVAQYYCLENFKAHGWIAHQRYPTRGKMWHPGGAHPFSGMHEALVHNGDFANYHAVSEYLNQYKLYPQFLTDTETSILLFDLYNRTFRYPLEYIIEALAPTTEYDFDRLSPEKQHIYRYIQSQHISGSPDGPWFFIIARNDPYKKILQLLGITDTAMLRPQVFALEETDKVQIGLVCSEKQAIDATLQSIAAEDKRFCPIADKYWNARGGSASDGGAFSFTLKDSGKKDGSKVLVTENKFKEILKTTENKEHYDASIELPRCVDAQRISNRIQKDFESDNIEDLKKFCVTKMAEWDFSSVKHVCTELAAMANENDANKIKAIKILTHLNDKIFSTGNKKRNSVLQIVRQHLTHIFDSTPCLDENTGRLHAHIDFATRDSLRAPEGNEKILVVNAREFEPEGDNCDARVLNRAYRLGWETFICYGYRGQRFTGCGFGKGTEKVKIDVYDNSGDYLASGIDGMQINVHGNGQDQIGQIMKTGKLVVHGDVGQTFMYGAKGGDVYIMGNAAGRPLINATGHPRVVINGTCLDYLAESFMAGDPLNKGGFVIVNGISFDDDGRIIYLETPYSGSNLFSLASGGAIYLRDPEHKLVDEQLNGGEFTSLARADWELILPYLEENEKLFDISIQNDLLCVNGRQMNYNEVYRKVRTRTVQSVDIVDKER